MKAHRLKANNLLVISVLCFNNKFFKLFRLCVCCLKILVFFVLFFKLCLCLNQPDIGLQSFTEKLRKFNGKCGFLMECSIFGYLISHVINTFF